MYVCGERGKVIQLGKQNAAAARIPTNIYVPYYCFPSVGINLKVIVACFHQKLCKYVHAILPLSSYNALVV